MARACARRYFSPSPRFSTATILGMSKSRIGLAAVLLVLVSGLTLAQFGGGRRGGLPHTAEPRHLQNRIHLCPLAVCLRQRLGPRLPRRGGAHQPDHVRSDRRQCRPDVLQDRSARKRGNLQVSLRLHLGARPDGSHRSGGEELPRVCRPRRVRHAGRFRQRPPVRRHEGKHGARVSRIGRWSR